MNNYNDVLVGFSELIKNDEFRPYEGELRLGVDLGTANIVVSVVDANNTPIAGTNQVRYHIAPDLTLICRSLPTTVYSGRIW